MTTFHSLHAVCVNCCPIQNNLDRYARVKNLNSAAGESAVVQILLYDPSSELHLVRYQNSSNKESHNNSRTRKLSSDRFSRELTNSCHSVRWVKLHTLRPEYLYPQPLCEPDSRLETPFLQQTGENSRCSYCGEPPHRAQVHIRCTSCSSLHHYSCLNFRFGNKTKIQKLVSILNRWLTLISFSHGSTLLRFQSSFTFLIS